MRATRHNRAILLPRIPVQIRAALFRDVERMRWSNGVDWEKRHRERVERQLRGEAEYLVALVHDYPVGHAFLSWRGKPTAPAYPDVEDVRVYEPFRGVGIGTALLDSCEQECRDRGVERLGLSVDVENARARALYERLGYRVEPTPSYPQPRETAFDDDSDATATVIYVVDMAKTLRPQTVSR